MSLRKYVLRVIAALILGILSTSGPLLAKEPAEGSLILFKKSLANMGFTVQEGRMDFPDIVGMCCQCQLPSCFANNPASPYGIFVLPPSPSQPANVPNPYSEWFTEDQVYPAGWSWFWRLRADEAVVFLGTTPPEMDYFGFTAYLYDRYDPGIIPPDCTFGSDQTRPPPPSALDRLPLFASLGDTVNNMVVKVPGDKKNPFLKEVVFILAVDQNIERRIRMALHRAGYLDNIINTVVVSPNLARLGVESDKDSLTFVLRMASDMTPALQRYIDSPKTLVRVSPTEPIPASELHPLALPKLRVRGTGITEVPLLPLVDQLGRAIVAAYPDYDVQPIHTVNWYEGYNCIENGLNCLGDNRDTPYIPPVFNPLTYIPEQDLALRTGEFYVAYGVNHKASRKATYSNVAILGWTKKSSPMLIDNNDMVRSADYYLGLHSDDPRANLLYAFVVARPGGCVGDPRFCIEVGYDCASGVAEQDPLALVFRAYLEPRTEVGPAYAEIVIDRILKFIPKP